MFHKLKRQLEFLNQELKYIIKYYYSFYLIFKLYMESLFFIDLGFSKIYIPIHFIINVFIIVLSIFTLILCLSLNINSYIISFVFLIYLYILYKSNPNISPIFYIACGIGGAIIESLIILFSPTSWKYDDNTLGLVPIWLIPLWAIAGSGIFSLSKIFEKNKIDT